MRMFVVVVTILFSLPAQAADECAEISRLYRNAQVGILAARLDLHMQRLAPQQTVAWTAMVSAQATLSHVIGFAQMHGCKLPPPKYPSGVVTEAEDRACGREMSKEADKPQKRTVREVPECAHYVAAAQAIREGK
ncbi:hypothetical protein [Reyranella sp. CPCC 100927]|uniref:hypothetical protein n=1 Tax=Reyranella sp. CPCC 100927 TaxID=2599616 RepID=UPI0011B4A890|nr:hypothetical protein [Reyranella sp. CPCC 100927]TWT10763.1 hypothetical protein FQU96_16805 [Reyranella sp. CPCC 100927]